MIAQHAFKHNYDWMIQYWSLHTGVLVGIRFGCLQNCVSDDMWCLLILDRTIRHYSCSCIRVGDRIENILIDPIEGWCLPSIFDDILETKRNTLRAFAILNIHQNIKSILWYNLYYQYWQMLHETSDNFENTHELSLVRNSLMPSADLNIIF